jgi:hypothetical protein
LSLSWKLAIGKSNTRWFSTLNAVNLEKLYFETLSCTYFEYPAPAPVVVGEQQQAGGGGGGVGVEEEKQGARDGEYDGSNDEEGLDQGN